MNITRALVFLVICFMFGVMVGLGMGLGVPKLYYVFLMFLGFGIITQI